jgi:hypothetical protein
MADFIIGKHSGQQLVGTFGQPGQVQVIGTWVSTSNSISNEAQTTTLLD